MALKFGERIRSFLDEPFPTILGTVRADGSVEMNPLWFERRGDEIWLNGGPARDWVRHIRRDPRVTLLVVDPKNMFRWARIQGRVVNMTEEGAGEDINRLSHRYNKGADYPGPLTGRLIVQVDPQRVQGGENMQPWDVSEA
jgi:PPOX class probable F420-dependent enzyme